MRQYDTIYSIAKGILEGRENIVEGIKILSDYELYQGPLSEKLDFKKTVNIFWDFNEEVESYPVSQKVRQNWSETALQIKDAMLAEIVDKYRSSLIGGCELLIGTIDSLDNG